MSSAEASRSDHAAIKRSARNVGKISQHDSRVSLPRSDSNLAVAAEGKGITWTEGDRKLRGQLWAPTAIRGQYWLAVWSGTSYFPGEFRTCYASDGAISGVSDESYNASGKRAHRFDGSTCYGGHYKSAGVWQSCEGCKTDKILDAIAKLTGKRVRVEINGDESYGHTLRWGILREVSDGRAVLDDCSDCNGIREYVNGSYSGNGASFPVSGIHEIKAA